VFHNGVWEFVPERSWFKITHWQPLPSSPELKKG
jgi:hypothetical protein